MKQKSKHSGHRRPHHFHNLGDNFIDMKEAESVLLKVFPDENDLQWLLREALNDGPPHRQMRNALILKQLVHLIKLLPVSPDTKMISIEGRSPKGQRFDYSVGIPENAVEDYSAVEKKEVLSWVGEGPYHDVAMDLLLMHVLTALKIAADSLKSPMGKVKSNENGKSK